MKKMILAVVAVAVVGMSAQTARAGDREWATAGKVLVGVAAGVAIARAVDCEPTYVSASYGSYGCSSPSYSVSYSTPAPCPPPRVVCAPAPVHCAPAPAVIYYPAPCPPRQVVYYTPAPVYQVSYARSHGYGHGRSYSNGRWNR
jgi:hypothetical protein